MQVNRYSQAADIPFISTYVPIDFDTMYRIGTAQKQAVDDALKDLSTNLKTWKEFTSPSIVDTDNWYKLTMGQVAPIVNEMVKNPDLIKSAEGRYRLQNAINNVDYASLSKLKKGAEQLTAFNQNKARLQAAGMWNPSRNWNNKDTLNYNTLQEGILQDISPLQYKSLGELVRPYIEGIKPSFIAGNVNPNDPSQKLPYTKGWMAITNQDLYRTLNEKVNEIVQTPQGYAWYKDIADTVRSVNPNATDEEISQFFINQMMQDAQYKLIAQPVDDTMAMQQDLARYKYRLEHPEEINTPLTRSGEILASLERQQKGALQSYAKTRYDKDYDNLSEEERFAVVTDMIQDYQKDPNKLKDLRINFTADEYFQYYDPNKVNRINFTNKKGEKITGPDMESYQERPGDVIYTVDGYVANDVPKAFIAKPVPYAYGISSTGYVQHSDAAKENSYKSIDMNQAMLKIYNVLSNIEYGAFKPSGTAQIGSNRDVLAKGYLYVGEDDLKRAFELTYPDEASDLFELYTNGYKEKPNSRKIHKIAEKVDSDSNYINGDNTIYRINIGRSLYGDFSQTSRSDLRYASDVAGTSYVKDNIAIQQGQSYMNTLPK